MERLRRLARRHDAALQVAIVLAAVESYELARRAMRPDWPVAIRHARDVLSLERVAHVAWELHVQDAFLRVPALVRALNVFYLTGHFVLTAVFFVWLYRRSRPAFGLFRNAFLVATAIAVVVHWRFPTAPPRLAGVGLEDTLERLSHVNIGSPTTEALTNPVAAVPSLHAGWALGVGVGLVLYARPLAWRVAGALYPALVVLTIVVTGNHFVVDAVAGLVVMGLGLGLARLVSRRGGVLSCTPRRGVEQPGSSPGS